MKKLLVSSFFSMLALTSVKAENFEIENSSPTFKSVAYKVYDGGKDVALGTKSVAYGVGSLGYDIVKVSGAVLKGVIALGEGYSALANYISSGSEEIVEENDAPKNAKYFSNAKEYLQSAVGDLLDGIGNLPTTFNYFKEGLSQDWQGIKKIGSSVYAGIKEIAKSETAQSARSAVKSAASKVGSWFSNGFSKLASKISPSF